MELYSEEDIISNVQQINNILDNETFCNLKNIINTSNNLKKNNIFTNNQYYINLFSNNYVTETIFSIIKTKFNYKGILLDVICKIQSHTDIENYHTISNDTNSTVFTLDINSNTNFNIDLNNFINLCLDETKKTGHQRGDNNLSDYDVSYCDLTFSNNELLEIPHYNTDNHFLTCYYLQKQNLLDHHGYLSFMNSYNANTAISYEHINNNCIKFPGHYIHKTKPYFKFSNFNRVSILFISKNI